MIPTTKLTLFNGTATQQLGHGLVVDKPQIPLIINSTPIENLNHDILFLTIAVTFSSYLTLYYIHVSKLYN
jgi:hypothetical protein